MLAKNQRSATSRNPGRSILERVLTRYDSYTAHFALT